MLFFNIDFFRFRPRFWRVLGLQDGAKSAALLAAPGVLDPTAFYACINILLCMLQGRPGSPKTHQNRGQNFSSWGHVGIMLALFSLLLCFCNKIVFIKRNHRKNCGFALFRTTKNHPKSALGTCLGLSWACLGLSWASISAAVTAAAVTSAAVTAVAMSAAAVTPLSWSAVRVFLPRQF